MNGKNQTDYRPLNLLADSFVDDVLNISDEDVLSDFEDLGGNPEKNLEEMLGLFQKSLLAVNKKRMAKAKEGVLTDQRNISSTPPAPVTDISRARSRLKSLLSQPGIPPDLTLAARNESDLSEDDVMGMLSDLDELGIRTPDFDEKG